MAKVQPNIMPIRGTIGDITYVKRGDKYYARRKRGTVKKASINEGFRKSVNRNAAAIKTAMPINSILADYAGKIREGAFWQRLLKCIKKCPDDNFDTHLQSLSGVELNSLHQLSANSLVRPYAITCLPNQITVTLKFNHHFRFRYERNCYYYDLIAIRWDKNGEVNDHDCVPTPWIYLNDPPPDLNAVFKRSIFDKYYLFALKVTAGLNGGREDGMADMAMAILGGGILDSTPVAGSI